MRPAAAMLVAMLVGASCAGGPMMASKGSGDPKRDEILMLDGKILDWRRQAELDATGPAPFLIKKFYERPDKRIIALTDDVPDQCTEVCDLADYICQAADDICKLAGELGEQDDWARRKCANAKASCSEARDKCSGCAKKHDGSQAITKPPGAQPIP